MTETIDLTVEELQSTDGGGNFIHIVWPPHITLPADPSPMPKPIEPLPGTEPVRLY